MKLFKFFFLAFPAPLFGQTIAFEGSVFPEVDGFQRDANVYLPERWITNGWFTEQTDMESLDPYLAEQDFYRRSVAAFAGTSRFFVEWRMQTDGPRSAIPYGAPAVFTASGSMGIHYHFTIARDQARLIDSVLDVFLFDIEPGVAHLFRLEIRQQTFDIFIDGSHVHAGTTSRSYPGSDSVIVFGNRAPAETATTRWDYIRFGKFLDAQPGDLNCDGSISLFDIDPFVQALSDPDAYGQSHPACNRMLADTNGDGSVSQFDIVPFVDLLIH